MITIQRFYPYLHSYIKMGSIFQTCLSNAIPKSNLIKMKGSILFSTLNNCVFKQCKKILTKQDTPLII